MGKLHSQYVCQQCSYQSPRWFGKCPECGSWNTAVESLTSKSESKGGSKKSNKKPVSLTSILSKNTSRISTKIFELDRVLGGGLVGGQVILIAGEPGIGKSTILLQVADNLSVKDKIVLYVSGEESTSQIKIRADRLGVRNGNIQLMEETDIDSVINTMSTIKDRVLHGVIVDSIQTMATNDLSGMAGSVGQVRECTYRLVRFSKGNKVPVFF